MHSELKLKTIRAAEWSFLETFGQRLVQFAVGIILARLLLPEQFGLIGMLTVFMMTAQIFLDSGFGSALIQRKQITQEDTCSIFYFNIIIGILVTGLLCLVAPLAAAFYKQPILTPLLRLMSLLVIINSFGMIHNVLLMKTIDFKTQAKISLTAGILSGMIGIGMAHQGFGVWSLAAQQLSNAVFRTTLLWFLNSWRPTWCFSFQALRQMFGFGSKLLASGLLNTIFDNIYLIVIGKLFSPASLGYFTRANNIQQFPSMTVAGIVGRVTFPVFSTIQDDPARLKRVMKKALMALGLINFPLMIGLAVVARPLVLILLTEKWLPCVPYLQLLCLVGLLFPLHLINLFALQAMGRSDLFLKIEVVKKVLIIVNIAITWRWGIMAMIAGQVIINTGSYYLNTYFHKSLLNYSVWEQIRNLWPYLVNALLMGAVVHGVTYLPINNQVLLLICQIFTGGMIYLLMCRIFQFPAYIDLQQMVLCRLPFQTAS